MRRNILLLSFVTITAGWAAEATAAGTLTIAKAEWKAGDAKLDAEGRAPARARVTLKNAASNLAIGSTNADREGKWEIEVRVAGSAPCNVTAEAGGQVASARVRNAPSTCGGTPPPPNPTPRPTPRPTPPPTPTPVPTRPAATLAELAISGPESVEALASVQLAAGARYSDGSRRDVTAAAAWSEGSPFATVAAGKVTASAVNAEQTVAVAATYAEGGVTRSASRILKIIRRAPPVVTGSHAGRFASYEGTKTCLTCHLSEAKDMHASVHYQWLGDANEALGLGTTWAGKYGGINDFCIFPDINWIGQLTNADGLKVDGGCARCHAGLGAKPTAEPTQAQLENIDCLLCHSPKYKRTVAAVNGTFQFVPNTAAMGVSILQAATDITKPSKDTCLDCHTKAGGGNNFKRGDIEEAHRNATGSFDVHMAPRSAGGAGLACLDCHTAAGHRIAGRGVDLRERDVPDKVECSRCHSATPHGNSRLDGHARRLACQSCHAPAFAKVAPTDMMRDWSLPGDLNPETKLWEPHMTMAANVTPAYRFFDGTSDFYQFGDAAQPGPGGRILMAGPRGSIATPGAKIIPVKHHLGRQPIDPATRRLLPLKIGIFFSTGDVATAVAEGTKAVGWTYSGHEFAETERYMGIFHEIAPAEQAVACASCHGGGRMDFAALGYTPKSTRNGKPLCTSCHGNEGSLSFTKLHEKHVTDKRYDCSTCHGFSKAS
jgi:hypothetical protein